ncbi:MAG: RloB family protein [Candidatus Muirbacterium halophilum]|nr:RloB family protein [Candidatus Muirbacterium halophilum]
MYNILIDKQDNAIKNSKKLYSMYINHNNPQNNNPSTTVHLLIEELNKFID